MKILFIEWESFGHRDVKRAIIDEGHELVCFPFGTTGRWSEKLVHDKDIEDGLCVKLHEEVPDVVFSINYFPVISSVCLKEKIRYVSWSYDCPHILLYSTTIVNPCNEIYIFDKQIYAEYHDAGISTVRYLPLAADTDRLDRMGFAPDVLPYQYDVSFVGSLYLEKGNYFDQIEAALPERARGYLKGLIAAQLKVQGYDLIEGSLAPIMGDLYRACPMDPMKDSVETREYFYDHYVIKRRVTAIERINILEAIAKKHTVDLFTHIEDFTLPNLYDHGTVDYETEMPLVFKQSKIDLNITQRSTRSGIPLRAFDIMGAGGFLLSNYQADLLDLFVPDVDFVYYENIEDLLRKVDYYLRHDAEREAIAKNGHDKVAAGHTYRHRIQELFG